MYRWELRVVGFWSLFLRLFCFLGVAVSSMAFSEEWEVRDPHQDIVNTLSSERNAGWVITGKLDVDDDGDLDLLVAHEYLLNSSVDNPGYASFLVYFREGDKFLFSRELTSVPIYFDNVEFRQLKGTSTHRALIRYETVEGVYDRVVAVWYEREASRELKMKATYFPASAVIDPSERDIASKKAVKEWAKRGLTIDEVLQDYSYLGLEEARLFYDVVQSAASQTAPPKIVEDNDETGAD